MTLGSDNVRFMRIFAVVLKIYVNCSHFMSAPLYYVYTYLTFFRYQVQLFVYDSYYLPIRLRRVVKCVTSGDVESGLAICDPQSIWNPLKNCGSFVDATSSES